MTVAKLDVQLALQFMNNQEESNLEIITEDEHFYVKEGNEIDFGEKVFVIKSTPRIQIKYNDVENIMLNFESDSYWEFKRYLDVISDAWGRNLGGYLHVNYDEGYYDLIPQDLLYYDDKTAKLRLDGEEKMIDYKKIERMEISMVVV